MKILFLDDEAYRHEWADAFYKGHEVHHAYTQRQFLAALAAVPKFDVISFDYDIESLDDPNRRTGLDCAKALIAFQSRWPRECIVHSWNPRGKMEIFDALTAAGLTVRIEEACSEAHNRAFVVEDKRASQEAE